MALRCGLATSVIAAVGLAVASHPSLAQVRFPAGGSRAPGQSAHLSPTLKTIHLPMGGELASGVYRSASELDAAIAAANPRRASGSIGGYPYHVRWDTEMVVVCPAVRGTANQTSQSVESIDHKDGTLVVHVLVNRPGPDDVLAAGQPEQIIQAAIVVPLSNERLEFKTRTESPLPAQFLMREMRGEIRSRDNVTWLVNGDVNQVRVADTPRGLQIGVEEVSNDGKSTQFRRNAGTTTSAVAESLAARARESGFLDLKDSYGKVVPDIDQRVRLIRVNVDGRKKEVRVRDDPSDPVPLAFERMWRAFRDAKAQSSLSGSSWGAGSSGGGSFSGGGGGSSSSGGSAGGSFSGTGGFGVSGGSSSSSVTPDARSQSNPAH